MKRVVELRIDLVKGDGAAKGKAMPLKMPMGMDCYMVIKGKCVEMLKVLEEWKDAIQSTDFPKK